MEYGSDYYREVMGMVRRGSPPLGALQNAARKRGQVVAVPLSLAEFLRSCTTGEALRLLDRAAERAAERERSAAV